MALFGVIILFIIIFLSIVSLALVLATAISAMLADECHIRLEYDGEVLFEYHKDKTNEEE